MKIVSYNLIYGNNSFIVDTEATGDENVIAIVHTEGPDLTRDTYIGTGKFWVVHDKYDINVLDGQEETFYILERLCERIMEGWFTN